MKDVIVTHSKMQLVSRSGRGGAVGHLNSN
jgi:hypothetical protein